MPMITINKAALSLLLCLSLSSCEWHSEKDRELKYEKRLTEIVDSINKKNQLEKDQTERENRQKEILEGKQAENQRGECERKFKQIKSYIEGFVDVGKNKAYNVTPDAIIDLRGNRNGSFRVSLDR